MRVPVHLVRGPSGPGALQMALDVAMASRAARERVVVVRTYRFDPPTLSLGRFQSLEGIYLPGLLEIGAGICRRPTGGQAVLHDDEVTYSIACPREFLSENVLDSYDQIAKGLIQALAGLGVPAAVARRDTELRREANCFLWPAPAEIVVGGRKLIGSAQSRMGEAFLQHGALPLTLDPWRWAHVFAPPEGQAREELARRLAAHATSLRDVLGTRPDPEAVAESLATSLAELFGGDGRSLAWEELLGEGVAEETYRVALDLPPPP